jgi:hypothetical protein
MVNAVTLVPDAVYDDGALYCALGLTAAALARGRREGTLRFVRKGNRTFYLGCWLLNWLSADKPAEASRE